ncbi:MAG: hypothetical protein L0170_08820, partial [Acidobacteria bacterium]|nr:hypothetical protein [Acidobacteriota bacterium]
CFLVSACEAVRDYPRAFEWCDRIAEFSQRYGSRYMLGFCRVHRFRHFRQSGLSQVRPGTPNHTES